MITRFRGFNHNGGDRVGGYVVKVVFDRNTIAAHYVVVDEQGRCLKSREHATVFATLSDAGSEADLWGKKSQIGFTFSVVSADDLWAAR